MRIVVGRVLEPAAGVADVGINYAGHVAQNFLDTPKTAAREHRYLRMCAARDCRVFPFVLIIHNVPPLPMMRKCEERVAIACGLFKISSSNVPTDNHYAAKDLPSLD